MWFRLILNCLKHIVKLFIFLMLVKIIWMSMFAISTKQIANNNAKEDLFARQAYLVRAALEDGSRHNLRSILGPHIHGEWQLVTYSMLTAALVNMAFDYPESHHDALAVVEKLVEQSLTPAARQFDTEAWGEDALLSLTNEHGHVGYLGHLNFMLGARRLLGGDLRYDGLFLNITRALARRAGNTPGYCIETYPGATWVPDNVVAMASLRFAEQALGEPYEALHRLWRAHIQEHLLDKSTRLPGFITEHGNLTATGSRGSEAAWNIFFLSYADPNWAMEQYRLTEVEFLVENTYFAALYEYPGGRTGLADCDSGPIVFGLSSSGTGFEMAGVRLAGNHTRLAKLLRTAEAAGFSIQWQGERRYALAPLVGDAIILAMRTARNLDKRFLIFHPIERTQELGRPK